MNILSDLSLDAVLESMWNVCVGFEAVTTSNMYWYLQIG